MKILQLNVWGGKLEKQILSLLKREDADVVCLQELVSITGGSSFLFVDMQEIMKAVGYEYAYHTPSNSFNYMRRKAHWGNAILSRLPIEQTNSLYTYEDHVEDFDFLENSNYNIGRVLQHVVVNTEHGPLNVLNHRGYHLSDHKNGDDETLRQCGMIADYTKDLKGSVVLCGDFNLIPTSESIELINKVLVNHAKDRGIITTRTPLTHKTEACDYIFTSTDLEIKNFQVLDDIASDHKALTVEF